MDISHDVSSEQRNRVALQILPESAVAIGVPRMAPQATIVSLAAEDFNFERICQRLFEAGVCQSSTHSDVDSLSDAVVEFMQANPDTDLIIRHDFSAQVVFASYKFFSEICLGLLMQAAFVFMHSDKSYIVYKGRIGHGKIVAVFPAKIHSMISENIDFFLRQHRQKAMDRIFARLLQHWSQRYERTLEKDFFTSTLSPLGGYFLDIRYFKLGSFKIPKKRLPTLQILFPKNMHSEKEFYNVFIKCGIQEVGNYSSEALDENLSDYHYYDFKWDRDEVYIFYSDKKSLYMCTVEIFYVLLHVFQDISRYYFYNPGLMRKGKIVVYFTEENRPYVDFMVRKFQNPFPFLFKFCPEYESWLSLG